MDVGLKMTGCRVCSTEESAQGTWVSMASTPCPACPSQPEERTQTSHQCGQSEKWQAPRCGQIGRSQSPHSLCQAPSDIKALTPVQGSGPAAVLPRLYWGHRGFSGRYRCRTLSLCQSTPLAYHGGLAMPHGSQWHLALSSRPPGGCGM